MLNHRAEARRAGRMWTTAAAITLVLVAPTPGSAATHRVRAGIPSGSVSAGSYDPDSTGSLRGFGGLVDVSHQARSSTLGNADFPERDPNAQNLGNTAGGGLH
ncbi:hypothetical protein G3T14_19015 [Methylobacterium sp. BTF04]|uniref:hypothetical protein n=1 Tax=Methylobacterium sp. BTF04 TaxID=2708300 RepID=UPI0013D6B44B|nr:hypothetical protein [Methylobacterium sp. BTF04]NEU14204.1 hypothetical protein [Methylobacterium sp. BTF04]